MQQEQWIADRAMLQRLLKQHPEWTQQELANWIGRSKGWVKKWKQRLREVNHQNNNLDVNGNLVV